MGSKYGRARQNAPYRPYRVPHGQQIKKSLGNIMLTLMCGLVTILVVRGTAGLGYYTTSTLVSVDRKVVEDIDRVLREIRTDSELPDPENPSRFMHINGESNNARNYNWTFDEAVEAMNFSLGPKITDWDNQRRAWLARNPNFPSRVYGKPRVLLLTGSSPNPCDDPLGDHSLLKSVKNKIDYCRLHGIEIIYNTALIDDDFDIYWAKLPFIRKLMLSHPEAEWIWWMDSDAIFTDMAFELPLESYKDHNFIIHGYPDLLFERRSWIALNAGVFAIRNCQWSLDLINAWAVMGPRGIVRELGGKVLSQTLKGRPEFDADDQSALIYLLISQPNKWLSKVCIENSYYLHGFWVGLVDKYEEMIANYHPDFGDDRWPFVTHFVGCKPCGKYGDYPAQKCRDGMERAFNFTDNQVLRLYGFVHGGLSNPKVKRVREETADPLRVKENLDMAARISFG